MGKKANVKVELGELKASCFIIMPFTKAEFKDSCGSDIELTKSKLKHIYEKLISKAVKEYNKKKVKFKAKFEARLTFGLSPRVTEFCKLKNKFTGG